ncbi:MAG: phosphopantetheine-binding protein [Raoultibacter sp.]
MADTLKIVQDVLQENLDIAPEAASAEVTLESLGVDSLDMVELICDLEERCNTEFGEPDGLATIGDLVTYIDSL